MRSARPTHLQSALPVFDEFFGRVDAGDAAAISIGRKAAGATQAAADVEHVFVMAE